MNTPLIEVTYYRAFRLLKNGGMVAIDFRVGVTNTGAMLFPAEPLGLTDEQARNFGGNPERPVILENGVFYVDVRHAIDTHPHPVGAQCLEIVRQQVLRRVRR